MKQWKVNSKEGEKDKREQKKGDTHGFQNLFFLISGTFHDDTEKVRKRQKNSNYQRQIQLQNNTTNSENMLKYVAPNFAWLFSFFDTLNNYCFDYSCS